MLDGRLVEYFLVVAREQNMTKAAAELHVSQPALSAQIAALEKQLGIKLFRRTNKSTLLTEDGVLFRSRAQELVDLTNKIESEFTSDTGTVTGDIYLGCGETHIMAYISEVMRDIRKEHPGIRFHIYSGDAEAVLERLDKGLLDAGLLLGPFFHEKYDYTDLGRHDSFGLLVPADCRLSERETISLAELSDLPILVPAQIAGGTHDLGGADLSNINAVGSYNLITNATYMVEQGLCYALSLDGLVNTEKRNLRFIPFETEVKLEAFIVTKKYAYLSKAAKLFIGRIRNG